MEGAHSEMCGNTMQKYPHTCNSWVQLAHITIAYPVWNHSTSILFLLQKVLLNQDQFFASSWISTFSLSYHSIIPYMLRRRLENMFPCNKCAAEPMFCQQCNATWITCYKRNYEKLILTYVQRHNKSIVNVLLREVYFDSLQRPFNWDASG